jgi:Protein of unknown function (DUF2785)
MQRKLSFGRLIVKWIVMLITLFLIRSPMLAQVQLPPKRIPGKPAHDRLFWRSLAKNQYAVPAGQPVFPLVRELAGNLGSRDPELRDDLAYTIIATWIVVQKQLSAPELNLLLDEWSANLRVGVGESGTDSVLTRSFSALCLAALAERDLKTPFLGEERYRTLLADALAYLKDERDLRGFDPAIGWIHATAHTADLLAALASNPLFRSEDEGRVLHAISGRLSSAHEIFTYGEQDRLALVAAKVARRKDFDLAGFHKWLTTLDAADQRVWKDSPPHLELLQAFENDTYMLRGLATYLCLSPQNPALGEAQNAVMQSLQTR